MENIEEMLSLYQFLVAGDTLFGDWRFNHTMKMHAIIELNLWGISSLSTKLIYVLMDAMRHTP